MALMKILAVAVLLPLSGCSSKVAKNLAGNYVSTDCNFYLKYIDGYSLKGGMNIELHEDGTYRYATCMDIESGKWQVKDDRILLHCLEHKRKTSIEKSTGKASYKYLDCASTPNILYLKDGKMFEKTRLNKKSRRICYKKL